MNVRQATASWEMLLVFVSVGVFVEGTAAADPAATPGVNSPFAIRGTLPWHNFLSGPTAWNEADYRYPYDPKWGRLPAGLAEKLRAAMESVSRLKERTPEAAHRANLDWLADNLRFTLLLDDVGRKLEPAYALKAKYFSMDGMDHPLPSREVQEARRQLAAAPLEELFRTFARRVRSRGELGELSALNQKLWLEYRELDRFLDKAE